MFPKSYKLKWRLVNGLVKYIEILNKDLKQEDVLAVLSYDETTTSSLMEYREKAKDISSRWSPKAILSDLGNVRHAWDRGRASLDNELYELVNIISSLGSLIRSDCSADAVQAYELIVAKYNDESSECDPSMLTDKQFIKALNTLRAKKDMLLSH